jgi:general nucleoside transport system permease protein
MNARGFLETLIITLAALATSLILFGAFMVLFARVNPLDLYYWMYRGGFGTRSAWEDTLTRSAPLILTALCTALPARLGIINIGGEGALVLGGLAAVAAGLACGAAPVAVTWPAMALAGMGAGGLLIALVGLMQYRRGVNATIASLLLTYVVIGVFSFAVEGPMRDPASLNKPSTYAIPSVDMIGSMPFLPVHVHWGLALGVVACVLAYVLMDHSTFGFAVRMAGGNVRAAQVAGLPVGRLIFIACLLGGAAAGLAGMVEIAAVQGQANATLIAGYGFTGILVSFIARHHPLGILPAAVLFGGLGASGGVLQRHLNVPDASVQVLMGVIFVAILSFETLYGRVRLFLPVEVRGALAR